MNVSAAEISSLYNEHKSLVWLLLQSHSKEMRIPSLHCSGAYDIPQKLRTELFELAKATLFEATEKRVREIEMMMIDRGIDIDIWKNA